MDSSEVTKEFYAAVGGAICAWSLVEDGLLNILNNIVVCTVAGNQWVAGHKSMDLSGIIHHSTSNLSVKLDVIEMSLIHISEDKELILRWAKLRERVTKQYKKRNILAHSPSWGNSETGVDVIATHMFNPRKRTEMRKKQIQEARENFYTLCKDLRQFATDVDYAMRFDPKR